MSVIKVWRKDEHPSSIIHYQFNYPVLINNVRTLLYHILFGHSIADKMYINWLTNSNNNHNNHNNTINIDSNSNSNNNNPHYSNYSILTNNININVDNNVIGSNNPQIDSSSFNKRFWQTSSTNTLSSLSSSMDHFNSNVLNGSNSNSNSNNPNNPNNSNNNNCSIINQHLSTSSSSPSPSPSSFNIINIVQSCTYRYTTQTSMNGDVIVEVAHGSTHVRYLAHSAILATHSGYLRSAIRLDDRIRQSYHHHQQPNNRSASSNPNNPTQNMVRNRQQTNHQHHGSSSLSLSLSLPARESHCGIPSSTASATTNPNRVGEDNTGGDVASVDTGAAIVLYLHNVTAEQFSPLLTYMYTGYLDLNCDNIFSVLLATHVLHMPRALEICR